MFEKHAEEAITAHTRIKTNKTKTNTHLVDAAAAVARAALDLGERLDDVLAQRAAHAAVLQRHQVLLLEHVVGDCRLLFVCLFVFG